MSVDPALLGCLRDSLERYRSAGGLEEKELPLSDLRAVAAEIAATVEDSAVGLARAVVAACDDVGDRGPWSALAYGDGDDDGLYRDFYGGTPTLDHRYGLDDYLEQAVEDLKEAIEEKIEAPPRFIALLVGHEELRFQQDVIRLASAMADCGYVVNSKPGVSPADVMVGLRWLAETARKQDVVVFYTSGHGGLVDGQLRLYYQGGTSGWLFAADIGNELRMVKSRHLLSLIHSCFAGAFDTSFAQSSLRQNSSLAGLPMDAMVAKTLSETSGKPVIFAGPPDLPTWGNVFPDAVRSAFKKAKKDKKHLKWSKLFSHASEYVEKVLKDKNQHIHVDGSKAGDFHLWSPH